MNVTMKHCVAALGILAITSSALAAQQATVGPKWQGWIGCWSASPAGESALAPAPVSGPVVCITPSLGEAVDVTTIDEGKVVSTQRIDAGGAERPLDAKGCTGVQRASWSADERRVYLRSTSTCNALKATTTAILGMTASGEWIDVRGVTSYGNTSVRVARYRDAGIPAALPTEIANALRDRNAANEAARLAAGAAVGPKAVIEASHAADSAVVAAWLLERDQRFNVDAKTLVQLADAGVPGAVTDALVAVSNPQVFHFARASDQLAQTDASITTPDERPQERPRVSAMGVPYDPWSWGYSGYGYPYGYGYGSLGYGRYYPGSPYGYGYGYSGGYAPPIIVVTSAEAQSRGQMVKGRGYTQTQGGSTGTASERPRSTYTPPPPTPSSSGSSSSSGSTSSSSGSESSSSSGRTAKPRP